jgi:hypothetical protein
MTNVRNCPQYGSVGLMGLNAGSVAAPAAFGRFVNTHFSDTRSRSIAAPGFFVTTTSLSPESICGMYWSVVAVLAHCSRLFGGCQGRPRVAKKLSVAAQASSEPASARPCAMERSRRAPPTPAASRAAICALASESIVRRVLANPSR